MAAGHFSQTSHVETLDICCYQNFMLEEPKKNQNKKELNSLFFCLQCFKNVMQIQRTPSLHNSHGPNTMQQLLTHIQISRTRKHHPMLNVIKIKNHCNNSVSHNLQETKKQTCKKTIHNTFLPIPTNCQKFVTFFFQFHPSRVSSTLILCPRCS